MGERTGVAQDHRRPGLADGRPAEKVIALVKVQSGVDLGKYVGSTTHPDPPTAGDLSPDGFVVIAERLCLVGEEDAVFATDELEQRIHAHSVAAP